jgi:hypothetical protein
MHPTPVPPELVACWQDALVHWAHRASHDTLLGRAVKHNQLAWLATRYREAARGNLQDPIARDRLKAVQRAAAMLAFSTPIVREAPRRSRSGMSLLFAAIISTGLGLWLTDYMRAHQKPTVVSRQP